MANGTCHAQLAEAIATLKGEAAHLCEEQEQQRKMLEMVLQQINNLGTNYKQLAFTNGNPKLDEGSINQNPKVSNSPLFEENESDCLYASV